MKTTVLMYALLAVVLGMVVLNWRSWRRVALGPEPESATHTDTNKLVQYRPVLVVESNTVPEMVQSDRQRAVAQAVPILLKYYPEATEDQKRAVTDYMFRRNDWRKRWVSEAKEIKEKLAALQNPSVPESARIEIGRVHETEWKMMLATIKDVTETLDKSSVPFLEKHGLTDPNFQSDLRAAAYPAGKEPWEE